MFSNPKRIKAKASLKESWFDYYAGYSASFVRDVLPHVLPQSQGRVLDPWNGSGTTTTTACELGIDSTGIDINPVMVVVARAKLLTPGVVESLVPLAGEIVGKARLSAGGVEDGDPLLAWFHPSGARPIRSLADAITKLLTPCVWERPLYHPEAITRLSDLAAFFLVALFRTARSLVARFRPTNPTWIKSPGSEELRVRTDPDALYESFQQYVRKMAEGLVPVSGRSNTVISLGSSESLPIGDDSVQAVISSPPYCTRIDYAVATKPELAVLGCPTDGEFKSLRRRMMGGPVVVPATEPPQAAWGELCLGFLRAVESHPSKGSGNYYHKLFVQYFSAVHRSIREIDRVLVPGGHCVLVVQDSFYKEVHVDVAGYLTEMASKKGWEVMERFDFKASLVMARLNPKAQKYRSHTGATESVLWFRASS